MTLARTLPLPPGYRLRDVLAFHGRDAEGTAETVGPDSLRKGVILAGVPVVLAASFAPSAATCTAQADGAISPALERRIDEAFRSILGLRIDPAPFCAFAAGDPLLGALVQRQPGLRIVQSASVFEALTWAIIGQQINLPFAIALRRTFILLAGRQHSSGLWCYPEAPDAARIAVDELTARKFSRAKAETLHRFASLVAGGELDLDPGPDNPLERISQRLLAIKGIGPWTVNYGLLRGYGYADCSLHGDVAIRAALQRLLGEDSKPDILRTEQILQQYQPHRTMAAAHLWASLAPPDDSA
ncbi:DNA-3-methyladenine glycosylase family protein [Pseudoduganella albidiflava]|uniref:DNA-3-methyladenine glycosylase II n=1 Tax=Pseudoduganella albidiflava TaxID=321983 RepID=A0A411WTW1_9BURK|nr:DNA-3-methyladenine glycosylase 2 [Pseudoduganella albidiflava]QBI00134.1 DNA-3-methyladenine glycosylase 2 [Pseudoduganella albidiflava]GGY66054.1 3-methyladenine DNA glycosylase 2 [Pseudoduganella albidiflava]